MRSHCVNDKCLKIDFNNLLFKFNCIKRSTAILVIITLDDGTSVAHLWYFQCLKMECYIVGASASVQYSFKIIEDGGVEAYATWFLTPLRAICPPSHLKIQNSFFSPSIAMDKH